MNKQKRFGCRDCGSTCGQPNCEIDKSKKLCPWCAHKQTGFWLEKVRT